MKKSLLMRARVLGEFITMVCLITSWQGLVEASGHCQEPEEAFLYQKGAQTLGQADHLIFSEPWLMPQASQCLGRVWKLPLKTWKTFGQP